MTVEESGWGISGGFAAKWPPRLNLNECYKCVVNMLWWIVDPGTLLMRTLILTISDVRFDVIAFMLGSICLDPCTLPSRVLHGLASEFLSEISELFPTKNSPVKSIVVRAKYRLS